MKTKFDGCYFGMAQDEVILDVDELLRLSCELAEAAADRDGGNHDQLCETMIPYRGCRCGHDQLQKKLIAFKEFVEAEP